MNSSLFICVHLRSSAFNLYLDIICSEENMAYATLRYRYYTNKFHLRGLDKKNLRRQVSSV
jgi:hypothetical protein